MAFALEAPCAQGYGVSVWAVWPRTIDDWWSLLPLSLSVPQRSTGTYHSARKKKTPEKKTRWLPRASLPRFAAVSLARASLTPSATSLGCTARGTARCAPARLALATLTRGPTYRFRTWWRPSTWTSRSRSAATRWGRPTSPAARPSPYRFVLPLHDDCRSRSCSSATAT